MLSCKKHITHDTSCDDCAQAEGESQAAFDENFERFRSMVVGRSHGTHYTLTLNLTFSAPTRAQAFDGLIVYLERMRFN